jgi:hypothetical protein
VVTALEHGLSAGIPINVTGTKSVTADGAYIINSIPNENTFTYLCKDNQSGNNSIEDLYTSIITGEFFQGSQLRISDAEGITTNAASPSVLTVKTDSTHGFGVNTPFYFLNLNSSISQEFEASNTAAKSFDSSNSATAQTFDGSNTLSTFNIDWSNSATVGGVVSTVTNANTSTDVISVSHTTETFVGLPVGAPLYYNVTASSGYFNTNPRGVVFLKTLVSAAAGASTFTVSATPDGDVIDLVSAMTGTFQQANQARTFAGNNVDSTTEQTITIIKDTPVVFNGGNEAGFTTSVGVTQNGLSTVASYSGSLVNVTVTAGAGLAYYTGSMVRYSTTGAAATGLTNNTTYFIDTFLPGGSANTFSFTLKNLPGASGTTVTSISGGTGTQTFTAVGLSIDKDIFHVKDANFAVGDLLRYTYPVGGKLESGTIKDYFFVTTAYDAHNFVLDDTSESYSNATGGVTSTVSEDGVTYRVHTFETVGTSTFTVTAVGSNPGFQYLILAGGGAGGRYGGGGAGGLLTGTATNLTAQAYSIVTGAGGTHPSGTATPSGGGNNGGNSSAFGLTAIGGGGGGDSSGSNTGGSGGSGGGGGYENGTGGARTVGQGNVGSGGTNNGSSYSGGAGGGAGTAGNSTSAALGGNGGDGLNSRISGYNLSYAAGGGGPSFRNNDQTGMGGSNGLGGLGAKYGGGGPVSTPGWGGYPGRGSGGSSGYSGSGGVVIVRYPITASAPTPMVATGGTITNITVGGIPYRVHTFTTLGTSTFTISDLGTLGKTEYLLVAGGGGGAGSGGSGSGPRGGGGAGGMLTDKELPLPIIGTGNYTVIIGDGGAGGSSGGENNGTSGQNSSFGTLVAVGGGGGGTYYNSGTGAGLSGGSGGGSAYNYNEAAGTQLQGNRGRGSEAGAGGGGGAGTMGFTTGTGDAGGAGGNGRASSIATGTAVTYAGGGGAGGYPSGNSNWGAGGTGGGGRGAAGGQTAVAGTPNTGGGGGAGGSGAGGAKGGSGIFIIRYPLSLT